MNLQRLSVFTYLLLLLAGSPVVFAGSSAMLAQSPGRGGSAGVTGSGPGLAGSPGPAQDDSDVNSPGPFCGINCLYTALRVEGLEVDPASLMRADYVGSSSGSTIPQLLLAAQDRHAFTHVLSNLSLADLRNLPYPLILHVKSACDVPDFDHFILCMPGKSGLMFYDPPNLARASSGHELAALWDGSAIVVSSQPILLGSMWVWAGLRTLAAILVIFAVLACAAAAQNRYRRRKPAGERHAAIGQGVVVLAIGALAAGAYHLGAPEGFAAQRQAISAINHARFDPTAESVDLVEAQRLFATGTVFVDARRATDFAVDHVRGAVNLPPDLSRAQIQSLLRSFSPHTPLVIYCASPSCPYAARMARRLQRCGFENLKLFPGGWNQWEHPIVIPNTAATAMEGGL